MVAAAGLWNRFLVVRFQQLSNTSDRFLSSNRISHNE